VVYQESNGKKVPIALNLTSGIEVAVVRKPVAAEAKKDAPASDIVKGAAEIKSESVVFIASSSIVRVGETESVVDLPAGSDVKVGDIVLYKNKVK
jgi:hypothetical protein